MEDIKIIELFFNRDETAIQELSNKYSGYCYKIVWNLLNNHEDVEECLNDLRVLGGPRHDRHSGRYHPGGHLYYLHMLEKLHEDLQLIVFVKSRLRSAWMGMLLTFVVKWMN